ncbi:hypothetical protein F4778DRAFT_794202 [Xylariomycetidae sp. FL2044]|nr:hypothetical protein F4778DRAFT_794202 [Xylariomycetidae sp. FL2044]
MSRVDADSSETEPKKRLGTTMCHLLENHSMDLGDVFSGKAQNGAEVSRDSIVRCELFLPTGAKIDPSLYSQDEDCNQWYPGKCMCDCELCEDLAKTIAEGLAKLDNVLCAAMLSAFKTIIDVGLLFVPGGQASSGIKASVQGAKSFYENGEKAESFFGNWIGPACGVPDFDFDITKVFESLVGAPDSMSRGKPVAERQIERQADCKDDLLVGRKDDIQVGRKDDIQAGRQNDISAGRQNDISAGRQNDRQTQGDGGYNNEDGNEVIWNVCHYPERNECYGVKDCNQVIGDVYNHQLTINFFSYCMQARQAAVTSKGRFPSSPDVEKWKRSHPEKVHGQSYGWRDFKDASGNPLRDWEDCQVDEYPPQYLLSSKKDARIKNGQLTRWIPNKQNGDAANASTEHTAGITVNWRPEFTIAKWEHETSPPTSQDEGLSENPCWPRVRAKDDPGYTVQQDKAQYYKRNPTKATRYNYKSPWVQGTNGSKRDVNWTNDNEDYEADFVSDDNLNSVNITTSEFD